MKALFFWGRPLRAGLYAVSLLQEHPTKIKSKQAAKDAAAIPAATGFYQPKVFRNFLKVDGLEIDIHQNKLF